jgi:hypothetical protein
MMQSITRLYGQARWLVSEPHASRLLQARDLTHEDVITYCEQVLREDVDFDPTNEAFLPYEIGPGIWVGIFVWPKRVLIRAPEDAEADDSNDEPAPC